MAPAVALGALVALALPADAVAARTERTPVTVSLSAPVEVQRDTEALFGTTVRDLVTGDALAGVRIVLQRRAAGEGGWAEVDRTLTDAEGRAVLRGAVRPPATEFRARMPRTDDYASGRSAPVTVAVSPD